MLLTYVGYAKEEAQRRQVRSAFAHYLSPAMVEKLAEDPSHLKLGGEMRNMTMLFCDVRGFTTISEMFDAQGLTKLINRLLTPLTDVILRYQGTVDKYMGDCIMAFWNAPLDDADHGRHAIKAALEMNKTMTALNDKLKAEAEQEKRKYVPLKIGTGINSGDVVVGNMGSDQRFDYSVLGDNVNLASRLEGQCKTYGVDIVVGENTAAKAPDLALLEIDQIKVKGKTEAVRIYTALGDEAFAQTPDFAALKKQHGDLLAAYRSQKWDLARMKIATCKSKMNGLNLGGLYELYEERIAEFEKNPPPSDWDGVYVATSK
jgi:adenylate cyclase